MNGNLVSKTVCIILLMMASSCANNGGAIEDNTARKIATKKSDVSIVILGTIQDAGSPHIACKKDCCKDLFANPDKDRQVTSLGVVDNINDTKFLFEASPDISRQLKSLVNKGLKNQSEFIDGIFLTHAHIGHYTGLMYLGKEATNAKNIKVYAMPRMKEYLENNGPWSQLVTEKNILLQEVASERIIDISPHLHVTPFLVPHRDEFSETVGYKITGPNKTALFIPDIDKWEKWNKSIVEQIKAVDYAFLDATFYSGKELGNRDISEIPHPFIIESLELFKDLDTQDKNKVTFIHFNHTNPVLNRESEEAKHVLDQGFKIGEINSSYAL